MYGFTQAVWLGCNTEGNGSVKVLTSAGHAPISFFSGGVYLPRWSSSHCGIVGMVGRWRASRSFCDTQCSVCGWTKDTLTSAFFLLFTREDTLKLLCLLWFGPCAMLLVDGLLNGSSHALFVLCIPFNLPNMYRHRQLWTSPEPRYLLTFLLILIRYNCLLFFCLQSMTPDWLGHYLSAITFSNSCCISLHIIYSSLMLRFITCIYIQWYSSTVYFFNTNL